MRAVLVSLGSLIVAAACQGSAGQPDYSAVFDGSGGRWIDLSYAYSEETLYWPTEDGFQLEELAYGETESGYFYSSYKISTAEHGGTHLDAPIPFSRGGMSAEQIPLDRLIAPAVVADVAARATPDYLIDVGDLEEWERTHGRIPDGAILLLRTGWGERWPDRLGYLGTERTGPEAVAELHFPGVHPEAARWIPDQRTVAAVGIDPPKSTWDQKMDTPPYEDYAVTAGISGLGYITRFDAENLASRIAG